MSQTAARLDVPAVAPRRLCSLHFRDSRPLAGQPRLPPAAGPYRDEVHSGRAWHLGWRWLAVIVGVAVICCLPALASALPASVAKLAPLQLENRILGSQRMSFSGYAESDATFGLPPLPAFSSVTPLLDGVTRMRVWQASPDRWRVLPDTGADLPG
jgi:hypothetical protein